MQPQSSIQLSVLIVTWNAWGVLERCLASLVAQPFRNMEIIVVDNGSVDDTLANIRQHFPQVQLLENPQNLGLPKAVNRGLEVVQGEFVMLLDSDTEVQTDTISQLLEFMKNDPQAAIVAPRILTPEGQIEESARNLPTWTSALFGRQSVLTRWFPGNRFSVRYLARQHLGHTDPFRVEQVSAACMLLRKTVLRELGPMDEAYRCYWVDSDWCLRLRKMGQPIYCLPSAQIVHYENNRVNRRKGPWRIWQFHMGAARLYRRHYTWGVWDPRAWLAYAALALRGGLLLLLNELKSDSPGRAGR